MSAHTPGRLTLGKFASAYGGPMIKYVNGSTQQQVFSAVPMDGFDHDANARRLVACWNAFEGLATEEIEGLLVARDAAAAPVQSHAQVGRAIAKSKKILALVDDYADRMTAETRTTLRVALMDEFMGLVPVAVVRNGLNGMRAEIQAEGRAPRLKEGQQLYAMAGEVRA